MGFYSCLSLLYWACEGLEERRLATITEIHAFFVLYLPEVRDFGIGSVRTSLPTYRLCQNPNLLLEKRQSTKSHQYSLMPTAKCTCRPWTTTAWTCWSFRPKTLTTCCHFPPEVAQELYKAGQSGILEVQVKSLSTGGLFAAISCPNPRPNYFYVFYIRSIETYWLIPSLDFVKIASQNSATCKNAFKYSLTLATGKGELRRSEYIIKRPKP